jgi:hypothetical protein
MSRVLKVGDGGCSGKSGGRRAGGRAHSLVIFDRHAKLPIASGSVPLTTGTAMPQSM